MSAEAATVVWFRKDLRLQDNPAFALAASHAGPTLCLYIHDSSYLEYSGGLFEVPAGAAYWWLGQSLRQLSTDIESLGGSPLVLKKGCSLSVFKQLAHEHRIKLCTWNHSYSPYQSQKDRQILSLLHQLGIKTQVFDSALIYDPRKVHSQTGGVYGQFSPYWKKVSQWQPKPPLPAPSKRLVPFPNSAALSSWQPEDTPHWAQHMRTLWQPGEKYAEKSLAGFADGDALASYPHLRDYPRVRGTSRLSPHLAFGELSHRQVYDRVQRSAHSIKHEFLRQLAWREYSFYQLYHHPHITSEHAQKSSFSIAFRPDSEVSTDLKKWRAGKTGYPLVDAGMRELYATGWMHNRVRMVVACFLVKNLLIHWIHGARWFHDTLLDACVGNNIAGWQWIVSVMPHFRVFHPAVQSRKFDPQGSYIRLWVRELRDLPVDRIHDPYLSFSGTSKQPHTPKYKSELWQNYPRPMVDYKMSRERALAIYKQATYVKKTKSKSTHE